VKWQMADVKTLGFCHLPSDIRHSGCVFQHPAKGRAYKSGPEASVDSAAGFRLAAHVSRAP
jgi:hypothetical protein